MTQEEINKGNKIIAEFMGILESSGTTLSESGIIVSAKGYDYRGEFLLLDELRYDTSWDWLMPVVEKIEAKGFWTAIYGHTSFENKYKSCSIKKQDKNSEGGYVYNFEGEWFESKIEAVFQACVDFAKWYNNQIE